jgi:hypothetical protein
MIDIPQTGGARQEETLRPLSTVVHGESGTGKSWFTDTAPAPRLILDAEGGSKFTPSQPKVMWDPMAGPPPLGAETVIVLVRDFQTMQYAFQWLNSGQHDFQSVGLDSITELQKRCKDAIRALEGTGGFRIQDWGTLLDDMELLIRQFRDLWMLPVRPIPVTVFITTTQMDDKGVYRPHVQGGLKLSLPYFTDVVGYLYTAVNDVGVLERHLLVQNSPGFIAKDRTDRLGYEIVNPNIMTMLDAIYGPEQPARIEGGA